MDKVQQSIDFLRKLETDDPYSPVSYTHLTLPTIA